jgi:hypothetical protein
MFGTIAGGLLVGPWLGAWDVAWQSPASGLTLLASMLILALAGLALMAEGSSRQRAFAAQTIRVRPTGQTDTTTRPRDGESHVA